MSRDNRDNRDKASTASASDPLALLALLGIDTTGVAFPGGSLVGVDGNAFSVMGFVLNRLRRAGNGASVRERYQQQAMAGDYAHLLAVSLAFLGENSDDDGTDEEGEEQDDEQGEEE